MGAILSNFKSSIVSDIKTSISSNTSYYYAFAASPVANSSSNNNLDDYSSIFTNDWELLFGKKLKSTDLMPVIRNITWQTNTVYSRYDNTKDLSNSDFYVIAKPEEVGGTYNVFKCIDNANGSPSTYVPNQIQSTSFTLGDGYVWKYIYSISNINYNKFATSEYAPVYSNASISESALNFSGVEVVMISNSGSGYETYHNGKLQSIANSTLVQIEDEASPDNHYYTKNSIYVYSNNGSFPAQIRNITSYISNSQNWVYLDEPLSNTSAININNAFYRISPRIQFDTDGDIEPKAYSVINATSNSISNVIIIEKGSNITRASAVIVSNTTYGTGANLYCIVPPAGGHGSKPENELLTKGIGIYFEFKGTESSNISINTSYNKVGILKNPYILNSNNTKGSLYTSNLFSQILEANISPSAIFSNGEIVTGNTSGAKGLVVYSNSTVVHLVGDKDFEDGEYINSANGLLSTSITINTLGDLYAKDIVPLYIRDIDNVTRSNNQVEAFKLIIQV